MVQRAIRLYVSCPLRAKQTLVLDKGQSHYLATVMRRNQGELLCVFNGLDGEWSAQITHLDKNAVQLRLLEQRLEQRAADDLWLLFSPLKKERSDYLVEKASELGAQKIIPVRMRHSNNATCRTPRLKALAIEACEQCERLNVPEVLPRQDFQDILACWPEERLLLVCAERPVKDVQRKALVPLLMQHTHRPLAFAIGPEGGWHCDELALLAQKPFVRFVSLGPGILRAETAAVSALGAFQLVRASLDPLYS